MATQNEQIVQDIIRLMDNKGFGDARTSRESSWSEDCGLDSLDFVELVMDVERKFSISIPDDTAQEFKTIGDIADYVDSVILPRK